MVKFPKHNISTIFSQAMFGGYIYSYAVKGTVSMTSDQGAYLTSMYWVSVPLFSDLPGGPIN